MKMTIDEAIERCETLATKGHIIFSRDPDIAEDCNEKYKQLAEWLKELKAVRNLDKNNFSDGYNRGIDDFLKEADATFPMQSDGTSVIRRLEKIADRLKGGGSCE